MTNELIGGWLNGHLVRTARKVHRCNYWHGLSSGGRCRKIINHGERYIEGEANDEAGGYGNDRYCFECAGYDPSTLREVPRAHFSKAAQTLADIAVLTDSVPIRRPIAMTRPLRIVTHYDMKPIPVRHMDWTAIDDATYCGPGCPVGHGATEDEAIEDLMAKFEPEDPNEGIR